jgi:hypothetical protein
MRKVQGLNPTWDIAFFGDKNICSTVTIIPLIKQIA